jgi:2',3'-cyclic-nucleotide 2'-phosphodiesterase (5'-nucleotidase family)
LCLSLFGASAFAEGEERSADIVILFTSDVHCGVDQGFGYAGLQAVRDSLVAAGNAVILVDDGDNI